MKPIQTAVIGFGLSARVFHLPFLAVSPAFQLRAISTSQGEAVQAAWPGVRVYDSAEALLQATDAELLIITAPNQAHYPLASQALDRGLHVLIEKPFVPTVAEG
ncbi:MAG: oxidoreductase, partial [Candidatus Melainabacteria bacterium HGW-Melainabacteria-1]